MNHFVTLNIFGREFTFKTESDDTKAREIAEYFETEVKKVETLLQNNVPTVDQNTILVLAGMNVTSEYYNHKQKYEALVKDIGERSATVIRDLNKNLQ